jgi:pimeloyl-ACP methyl ester carboxylesterase
MPFPTTVPLRLGSVGVITAALLAGCGGAGTAETSPPSPSADLVEPAETVPITTADPAATRATNDEASNTSPPAATPPPDQARVVTAAGVSQYLECSGRGAPTVLIVPGLDSSTDDWRPVLPALREESRTCVYDRPGIGASPARPGGAPVDAGLHAAELGALLTEAGESGPYLVVGHSYGGLVARAFIHDHQPNVAGVVLAEGVTPFDATNGSDWPEGGTIVDLDRSYQATGDGPVLGTTPLVVLSASDPEGDHLGGPRYGQSQQVTDAWIAGQQAALALSSDAIGVRATSGHVLQQDNPAAVIKAVAVVLTAARSGTRLSCADAWSAVAATCTDP